MLGGLSNSTYAQSISADTEDKQPKIGVIYSKLQDNEFMSWINYSIESSAKNKALLTIVDAIKDNVIQNEQINDFIDKGDKVIAIDLVDRELPTTLLNKINATQTAIIFFGTEPKTETFSSCEKCWYLVSNDAEQSGRLQGEIILEQWNANKTQWDKNHDGKIQYVLLTGEPGHPIAEDRTQYVIDELKQNKANVQKLEGKTAMWDYEVARRLMDIWLQKRGDKIEFVIANNDGMALGAIDSLETHGFYKNGKFIPVVGIDGTPDALTSIEDGQMIGSVLNNAKLQGTAIFELSYNLAIGKSPVNDSRWTVDDKRYIHIPNVKVTKENVITAQHAYEY